MTSTRRSEQDLRRTARALADSIGENRVLLDPIEVRLLERDIGDPPELFSTLLKAIPPTFAVRPESTNELAQTVRLLTTEKVPMTPRGLSSTGFGGAIPVAGGAVLDLSHLRRVLEVDSRARTVRVSAGTTFFFLQRALDAHHLALRARPTNAFGSVGGWAASGGVGLGSMGAGPVSQHIRGVEVVLPGGRVERLSPSDTGFLDFFDTEGQLGILSELTLEVEPAPSNHAVRAFVYESIVAAADAATQLFAASPSPRTVILAGHTHEHPHLQGAPEGEILLVDGDAVPSDGRPLSAAHVASLWTRRYFPMDTPHGPVFLASEVLMPAERAAGFIQSARRMCLRYGVPLHSHSHAVRYEGSPSFLVLLIFPANPARQVHHLMLTPLAAALTSEGIRAGGKAYGLGVWNTPFAENKLGKRRLEALARRKRQIDPDSLMNPGKFFQLGTHAKLLPELMKTSRFRPSLRLASTATPFVLPSAQHDASLYTTSQRCIACGACVPVCPAVAATGAESVSARAKLALLKRLESGQSATREELLGCQRCLYCGQCAEVCARSLPLVEAWRELETLVRARVESSALTTTIKTFTEQVDADRARVLEVALP